ncbi:TPA: TerB family tellurite resistance protein [Vibrio parahaemolyticus]|uniref:TerB family tellurite resistance protein n=1 Tax=Vibrio alginolyticus TaxID=663 RepID=UPI001BD4A01D|nr:TerB family tellurite resistance protein [Vibrio alginolyticus]HCE2428473.1 TerB family tellurite resistance protein [Vibrio parahaemolyticus]HCE2485910.1 TerB family tellurite resistance protein [Vibrio parahaemolyticus]
MFLNLLKQDEQKKLFMQLANVMALSDGVVANDTERTEEGLDHVIPGVAVGRGLFSLGGLFSDTSESDIWEEIKATSYLETWKTLKQHINESETFMLELFAAEMGLFTYTTTNLSDWQELYFINDFGSHLKEALTQVSQAPDAKKKVMLSLAESDIDLAKVNQKTIETELLKISELRANIFSHISKKFIDDSKLALSFTEKKAIVFELIGVAYADNEFSELELATVKSIADCLALDAETFNELTELVAELNRVSSEALDLIQE